MLPCKTVKYLSVPLFLTLMLNGCAATYPSAPPDRTGSPAASVQETMPEKPPAEPVPPVQATPEEDPQTPAGMTSPPLGKPAEIRQVMLDPADVAFVRQRLAAYDAKLESWLELSQKVQGGPLAEEFATVETDCLQQLEDILRGYSLLLEKMQEDETVSPDSLAEVTPRRMQQLDIAFLESSCGEFLGIDMPDQLEYRPQAAPELTFDAAQEAFATMVSRGAYQEALSAYGRLAVDFPGQKLSLATRLNYGLALQYTGQVEAAARHWQTILASGEFALTPLSLQRTLADLLFAGGDIEAAESNYEIVLRQYDSLVPEKTWAAEQLTFLLSTDRDSEAMAAYTRLLREFMTSDYRVDAPRLNDMVNGFVVQHSNTPFADSALRLKSFALQQLQSWFDRQLSQVDSLAAEKKFSKALDILKGMTRYYFPMELEAILQKTYYEVSQAEIQEIETQRRIQEMALQAKWERATNLLDSERYDLAIPAFQELMGTEYEEKAKLKIKDAADQAAAQMRKEAASLFIRAGKTTDPEQKKELLRASHELLTEILEKYPQSDLLDKVQQNIAILELQIQRFDPSLLEELRQENPAPVPADPSVASPGPGPSP